MSGLLGAVEIAHEGLDAAFVVQLDFLGLDAAPVGQQNAHAGIEEGQFAQAMLERGEVEFGLGEGLGQGRKVTSVPRLPCGVADHCAAAHRHRRG